MIIIGGGNIAERKIISLLETGAQLEIVSPELTNELEKMAEENLFYWNKKYFSKEDLEHAFLVFAATNDHAINQFVKKSAKSHQLVSLLDDQDQSDFQTPAVVRRGKLSLAISTSGASPFLSKKIKQQFEQEYDVRYEAFLEFLDDARKIILKTEYEPKQKRKLLACIASQSFLDSEHRWEDFFQLLKKEMI